MLGPCTIHSIYIQPLTAPSVWPGNNIPACRIVLLLLAWVYVCFVLESFFLLTSKTISLKLYIIIHSYFYFRVCVCHSDENLCSVNRQRCRCYYHVNDLSGGSNLRRYNLFALPQFSDFAPMFREQEKRKSIKQQDR